ncbi:MFS transporter [Knoellia sinensis]|uniref:MFS transporter n=1 Tax=Knoellia sinensis TaxID=136100 RepID=UPI00147064FD|nr:MFS transporter [Knoellia sinensis]
MTNQEPTPARTSSGLGRLLASTGVSIAGQGMVIAAVPLLAASLTREPLGVSIAVAATYAAWLAVGLPAGALVDRWHRRLTMVVADLVRVALLGFLALAVWLDVASIPLLVAVVFLVGVAGCFFDPAAQAAIPTLVGRDNDALARANSKVWSLDMLGRSLVGPPLGAALFASAAVLPFAANAGTFALSAILLTGLRRLGRPAVPPDGHPRLYASLVEGVAFLTRHRDLRALTIGMGAFNLVYNLAYATLVLFAQDRLGISDRGFGFLLAMLAVGGLIGAWLAPRLRKALSFRQLYAAGLGVQGIAWIVVVIWQNTVVAGTALVAVGIASMLVTVVGAAARQSLTPDELLGRVSSGTRVVGIGSAAIGAVLGGLAANLGSLATPFLLASILALSCACAFLLADRRLGDRQKGDHPSKPA